MPTQADYITQIKADLKTDGGESDAVLKERLKRVKAAKDDDVAKDAYFGHLEELREEQAAKEAAAAEEAAEEQAEAERAAAEAAAEKD
jgi:hypothetical protein